MLLTLGVLLIQVKTCFGYSNVQQSPVDIHQYPRAHSHYGF